MSKDGKLRRKAKKLRLFSFWIEDQDELSGTSVSQRRAWTRNNKKRKVLSDLESFKTEIRKSGINPEGTTLCNCEMTGGNDISLIYPWVNINDITQDIWSWLDREEEKKEKQFADELMSASMSLDTVSLVKNISCDNPGQSRKSRRTLNQGTYCIVETVVPSRDVDPVGEQLCVLLGFRTTDDNCVDTAEADSERSHEARSWRDWTGIGTLYQNLNMENMVEVTKIEFLESHMPYHAAIFHYIVLVYLQVEDSVGKVGVLDVVARFRVRNMSGYVTVYYSFSDNNAADSVINMMKINADDKQQARREFFASAAPATSGGVNVN